MNTIGNLHIIFLFRMLSLRYLSKHLCSRCQQSYVRFQTASEAVIYQNTVSVLDPQPPPHPSPWLQYLTSLAEIDVSQTIRSLPKRDVTVALQVDKDNILLLRKVIITCLHCSFAKLLSHVNILLPPDPAGPGVQAGYLGSAKEGDQ